MNPVLKGFMVGTWLLVGIPEMVLTFPEGPYTSP